MLEMFAPGKIVPGDISVVEDPLGSLPLPAVATSVSYVDGVTGGNVFVMTLDGARKLAAAMMGIEQPEDPEAPELSELELSAVSEAMNQMMASAAMAISSVLGNDVEIGTPETKTFTEPAQTAVDAYPQHPARRAGELHRLRRAVPARAARAERVRRPHGDARSTSWAPRCRRSPAAAGRLRRRLAAAASRRSPGIPVRVWAELGRARMPSAQVVGMPPGRGGGARPSCRRRRSTSTSTARSSRPAA